MESNYNILVRKIELSTGGGGGCCPKIFFLEKFLK
jgi:hypothetical protein